MSQWTDEFTGHQIHITLQNLDTALSNVDAMEGNEVSIMEAIDRLRQVQRLVVTYLDSVDPNLVSQVKLNSLNALIQQQVTQIDSYRSNQNLAHLTGANNAVDDILAQLSTIPVARTPEEIEGLREAVISLRRSMGQHARNLESEYEKFEQQFNDVNRRFTEFIAEITSQKARLDTAISQFQQQFSDAESKRREDYAQEVKNTRDELKIILESGKQELSTLTTGLGERFDKAEEERQQKYSDEFEDTSVALKQVIDTGQARLAELTKQHIEAFESVTKEVTAAWTKVKSEFSAQVDDYIIQLELRKGEAETLVQVIGNTGMVGGYQKIANQERLSTWIWHGITFLFMIGLITFAIIAFHSTTQTDFKLGTFGARAFVALAFGIGVAWAARQAEKYQVVERRSRKMELELASINPYLALLPETEQIAVKLDLAKRFFGQTDPIGEKKSDKEVTGSALDLARMALEMLGKK